MNWARSGVSDAIGQTVRAKGPQQKGMEVADRELMAAPELFERLGWHVSIFRPLHRLHKGAVACLSLRW